MLFLLDPVRSYRQTVKHVIMFCPFSDIGSRVFVETGPLAQFSLQQRSYPINGLMCMFSSLGITRLKLQVRLGDPGVNIINGTPDRQLAPQRFGSSRPSRDNVGLYCRGMKC